MLRKILALFVLVVMIEGALRKWALPEYSNQIFAAKDVLLVLACVAYSQLREKNAPAAADFTIWLAWGLVAVAFAAVEASTQALIGLRYYLAPLPLVLLVPALIRSPHDLERIATWGTRIAFPIGMFAIIQYFSPVDSVLNIYARGEEDAIAGFGVETGMFSGAIRPRVTSTFSYISTFAAFLSAAWVLGWISVLQGRTAWDRRFATVILILIAFNMAMNGSRSLFFTALITGLPFAFFLIKRLGALKLQALAIGLSVAVIYAGVAIFEPFALTALRGDPEEAFARLWAAFVLPFVVLSEVGIIGAGMGATFGGLEELGLRTSGIGFDDINLDRVGVELGAFGYSVYLFIKVYLLLKAYRVLRGVRSENLRHWALAALLVQLGAGWQIPFHNSVSAIVYFCAVGLVNWIDRERMKQRTQLFCAQAQEYPRERRASMPPLG